ncbi:MAG: DCC1-like thiol-disulfide oxidoreductase family protein [Jaaginema sp. PMC 1080.18]|nr:DCC1-like thiol-disulfide oxidoreductase family protein [Jaaginema sp. PMC 1080.18]MEC4867140.1 DCC1-like thiol-disulfide oxidoreductase family protein [Jaaginema sp. PMC 1078.18]
MKYHVIYDGDCNLCSNFTETLANIDKGQRFDYIPMQDRETLAQFDITPQDCEMGMILIDADNPSRRWQGSNAAEEITNLLPVGDSLMALYRNLPGLKWLGDRVYDQIRDNRYQWFGKRPQTYHAPYPIGCAANRETPQTPDGKKL